MNELVNKQADAGLRELALFAGAGGGILGGHLLGWRTICAVEWEPYPASVLIARQNDGILPPFPVWDDVQTFDGKPWRGRVDVISGGFPCQDISCAGKGAGIDGERSGMWTHMARIIGEVRPEKVLVENSPMLVGRGLARVLGDLAQMGYDAEWCVLGARHVAAPHKRDRIWLVAESRSARTRSEYREAGNQDGRSSGQQLPPLRQGDGEDGSDRVIAASESGRDLGDSHNDGLSPTEIGESTIEGSNGSQAGAKQARESQGSGEQYGQLANSPRIDDGSGYEGEAERQTSQPRKSGSNEDMADTDSEGLERLWTVPDTAKGREGTEQYTREGCLPSWWATEPDVGRVAHGIPARVDRLKAIGNAQVPRVAELAWETLTNPKP